MVNLYKLPDSLANPANAILSSMDGQRPLADVANTKAAAAAGSPMPPPPPTPGTSGKKRKRSEASLARDKLVSSKKYQTYKVYEELQRRGIIDDPSEIDKLRKYIHENALLQKQAFDEYNKDYRASIPERSAWFDSKCEFLTEEIKKCDVKQKKAYAMYDDYYVKAKELDACWSKLKCELMEQKMKLMEDREELRKTIREEREWKEKYHKVYAEVKELRKLKYAADRKAKGPVGVAR